MVIKYLQKPFFLAALICCILFYSNTDFFNQQKSVLCLVNPNNITELSGTILNSPAKSSSGRYYSAYFLMSAAKDSSNTITSATGKIKIYIPVQMIEAYFPGKLYSIAHKNGAFLFESGASYIFSGKFNTSGFYVTSCTECFWPETIFGKIDYFRAMCRLQFKRLMFSWGKAGGLLLALLSGAKEYTDSSVADNFKNTGLSHILALSGMHLSMFSSIAVFIGNKIGRKKFTYILRIFTLILFVWFAGFSPSLLRAFICAVLSLIAVMSGTKEPDMILIISFSFLIQSIISPSDIWNIGFILSYGALTGIILFTKFFYSFYSKFLPGYFSASLSASTGAQIITIPVALHYFGSFAPIGIIATAIASPLITIFIYSGLILIIATLIITPLQLPSGIFINLQYTVIKFVIELFAQFPKWSIN